MFFIIFIFFFGLELTIRLLLPFEHKRKVYMKTRNVFQFDLNLVKFDKEVGYVNRPNLDRNFNNLEFSTTIKTNSLGYRDDESSLYNPDFLLLGDSFAFGWGVNKSETIDTLLENGTNLKMLNLSVSGHGTLQEYLLLKRWLTGSSHSPKTAFLLFYPNDINDNLGFGYRAYPTLSLENPEQILYPNVRGFLKWHEDITHQMYHGIFKHIYLFSIMRERLFSSHAPIINPTDRFLVFSHIVNKIKKLSKSNHLNIVFIYIPLVSFFENGQDDYFKPFETIIRNAAIPYIDLRNILERDDYYHFDDHWQESGHSKAADAIYDYLISNNLIKMDQNK